MEHLKRNSKCWTVEEQARFLKWLGTLLDRGYPIVEGLSFLLFHLKEKQQLLLKEQILNMKEGLSFHQALSNLSFHRDVLGYLYFAEQHGDLSFALKEGSLMLEQKVNYSKRLIKIVQYPLFLIVFTIMILIVMNVWLLPEFTAIFQSLNTGDYLLLNFMIFMSNWFPRLFLFFLLFISILILSFLYLYRKIPIVKRMKWMSKLPIYGTIIKKLYSQYFAMQLSQLLQGGLSIYEAISLFEKQHHYPLFQLEAIEIKKELRSGEVLASIIQSREYFENELSESIAIGSANGNMARELYFYSKLSTEALEDSLNKKLAVIQPTVFVVIGLMIMGIYLAIMQPTLQMMNGL